MLTAVSALNAHQLRPEVEPDGSLGMADFDSSFAAPCGKQGQACSRIKCGIAEKQAREAGGIGHPKRKRSFL
ncbi:hypothetical protein [Parabacteroides johnsonii]|uniref:hypothetical protein n=1 Tax=Parabacteroides johnsonii TaxID=387661 RepID=UPI00307CCB0F